MEGRLRDSPLVDHRDVHVSRPPPLLALAVSLGLDHADEMNQSVDPAQTARGGDGPRESPEALGDDYYPSPSECLSLPLYIAGPKRTLY